MSECITCSERAGIEGECHESKRPCGHHCNCVWIQDICHWCLAEVNEDGELVPVAVPSSWEPSHASAAIAERRKT